MSRFCQINTGRMHRPGGGVWLGGRPSPNSTNNGLSATGGQGRQRPWSTGRDWMRTVVSAGVRQEASSADEEAMSDE